MKKKESRKTSRISEICGLKHTRICVGVSERKERVKGKKKYLKK